jgi:arginyl-tRNA synthetase
MTSPLAPFRTLLATRALEVLGLPTDTAEALARQIRAPEPERGDLALPCFELAKRAKLAPPAAAQQVAAALGEPFTGIEAVGPYVNVRVMVPALAGAIVPAARDTTFGGGTEGAGKTVVIDYSSPNIAKPLAFHHIRSTVIGAALARIHAKRGWTVVAINYLGDWGKQFGLLATGFQRFGDPARRTDAKHLVEVYVRANQEADVEGLRAKVAAPEAARKQVAELVAARVATPAGDAKAEKKLKGLEKKLRTELSVGDEVDPVAASEAWIQGLEAAAAEAKQQLPAAEARDQEARLFLKRMEDGDPAALAEWQQFREASLAEFQAVYARMGVGFTHFEGESFYNGVLKQTVARVSEKPGTKLSDGARIVDLPYKEGEPPVLLETRDGTTLYITRDLAAAQDRYARFGFERSLYVVAHDQSLHFAQLIRTLGAMGFEWAAKMAHVPFGRVHGMSTRRGKVVFLDEVLDESVAAARELCEASERIDRAHLDRTVEAIGIGAIVFGDLKNLRMSDYTFRREDVVNFDGLTGPYVQFSHARCCSILRKAGGAPARADLSRLVLEEERTVLMALARVPEAVAEACDQYEPSLVTRAILELSQAMATYLTAGNKDRSRRVLVEDDDALRDARLALVDAARNTFAVGLGLLGLSAPDAM